jgi:hypothetical protein
MGGISPETTLKQSTTTTSTSIFFSETSHDKINMKLNRNIRKTKQEGKGKKSKLIF